MTNADVSGYSAQAGVGPGPHEDGRPGAGGPSTHPTSARLRQFGASLLVATDLASKFPRVGDERYRWNAYLRAPRAAVASSVRLGARAD